MITNNPALYRKLSEPFASRDAGNVALEAFAKDLSELREKHHIADLVCVLSVNAMEECDEGAMSATMNFGDPLKVPILLAQALGKAQRDFDMKLAKYLLTK